MSLVDNVILSFSVQEDFVEDTERYVLVRGHGKVDLMDEINAWTREHAGQNQEFGPDLGAVYQLMHAAIKEEVGGEVGDLTIAEACARDAAFQVVGGAKPLETPVFVAAFNYLPLDEFMEFLGTLPWRRRGAVQVIVKRQQSDVFEILGLEAA